MNSTRFKLTAEQVPHEALRHNLAGYALPSDERGIGNPVAGLHTTANDLLKFVSANLGLTPCSIRPLLEKNVGHFTWGASPQPGVFGIGGGGFGNSAYSGFDKSRRHGVVVLSTSDNGTYAAGTIGKFLLECEWQLERRPKEAKGSGEDYSACVGRYQRSPDMSLGMFLMGHFAPKAWGGIFVLGCVAALWVVLWRVRSTRKRWLVVGCVPLAGALALPLVALVWCRLFCWWYQPRIEVWRQGDRLFAQAAGARLWPIESWRAARRSGLGGQPMDVMFPPIPTELLPQSGGGFFERLSGTPMVFSRDGHGSVAGLTLHYLGKTLSYDKVSGQPPHIPDPPKPRVVITLGTNLLDGCVGRYRFAPSANFPKGAEIAIRREGGRLVGRAWVKNALLGFCDIFPVSETNFIITASGAQLTFIRNGEGQATSVIHHANGGRYPDCMGTRMSEPPLVGR